MPTVMSFDHFIWNNAGNSRWNIMLGSEATVQSFVDEFLVPMCERYIDNVYFWSVDLCNEFDLTPEMMDQSTPGDACTCTPVGGGSDLYDFNFRVSDYVVGTQLQVWGLSNNLTVGTVTERVSDTRVRGASWSGASEVCPLYYWGFSGRSWSEIQRYLALASAAIHRCTNPVLVTMGMASVKYSSDSFVADKYKDATLAAFTNDAESFLDYYQIHWYSWAQPWYEFIASPTTLGLTATKPHVMGEFSGNRHALNISSMMKWYPTTFSVGNIVERDDGSRYRCVTGGVAGKDDGPTGTGTNIVDGACRWDYIPSGNTWLSSTAYAQYAVTISDCAGTTGSVGRIYVCSTGGTSATGATGPTGTGAAITDGSVVWRYQRNAVASMQDVFDFFKANNWCGHFPWTSNSVDAEGPYGGLYWVMRQGGYPVAWQALTDYYPDTTIVNDGSKMYRAVGGPGKSAASGGPTGTGTAITDGGVVWSYIRTLPDPPWTELGNSAIAFSADNSDLIYPDISQEWNASGYVIRQSRLKTLYVPGVNIEVGAAFKFCTGSTGISQRVGWFDDDDGIFFERSNTANQIVVRSRGTDYPIEQTGWNVDPLDGNGDSSTILDPTKANSLILDIGWMHQGTTKVGFMIDGAPSWVHQISAFNSSELVPLNPELPVRWEIDASATASDGPHKMEAYSGYAARTPVDDDIAVMSYDHSLYTLLINGSVVGTPIALRVASTARGSVRPRKISILDSAGVSGAGRFAWALILNPTLLYAGTWIANGDVAEVNATYQAYQNTGTKVIQGFSSGPEAMEEFTNLPWSGVDVDGVSDVWILQIANLTEVVRYFWAILEWEEQT